MEGAALFKRALFFVFGERMMGKAGEASDFLNAVGLRFAVGRFLFLRPWHSMPDPDPGLED